MLIESERPQQFSELVGRDVEVAQIQKLIESKDGIPHLMLSGKAGIGKTTIAGVIASAVFGNLKKSNYYEFNASSTRGIEFIRNEVAEIAKRRALGVPYKIILLDEADNITPDAQACLKRILEIHSATTRFIFTCNHPFKIIEPLISRCVNIHFNPIDTLTIAKYLKKLTVKYNLGHTDEKLKQFAKMANGDLRLALNNLEGNVSSTSAECLDNLTLDAIHKMSVDDRMAKLAFAVDPELMFNKLWELVQKEKAWDKLFPMGECNNKMNMSVHKTLFIANLLEKHF